MIAINPKVLYRFEVGVRKVWVPPVRRNQRFLLTPNKKKNDDSNEYKFIYVLSSVSGEKKNILDERWVFNIFPAEVGAGEELNQLNATYFNSMRVSRIFD